MPFSVLPVIDVMLDLYSKPRGYERFREYLQLLQGDTRGDMVLPIGSYNPMAKEHVAERLQELKQLDAEAIMADVVSSFSLAGETKEDFKLVLNLADDLKGGWTNRFSTDYQTKFQAQALAKRGFCVPVFWTSEEYTAELVAQRTKEYVARTIWLQQNGKPLTLAEHIAQERFVAKHVPPTDSIPDPMLVSFYEQHKLSSEYSLIFNFMYGDDASLQLGYPVYGIAQPYAGFAFAAAVK